MNVFLAVAWLIAGIIMSVLYGLLAGGNADRELFVMFFGPPVALLLYFTFHISKIVKEVRLFFWFLLIYSFLPVLLNGISTLLKWMSMRGAADFIFNYRYKSLAAVLILLIVVSVISGLTAGFLNIIRRKAKNNINKPGSFSEKIIKLFRKKEKNQKREDETESLKLVPV